MMERNQELFEKIEAYLEGKLSPKDKRIFEKRIEGDAFLQKEVETHRKMKAALEDTGAIHFRAKIRSIEEKLKEEERPKRISSSWWRIAASFLLVIGVSTILWLQLRPNPDLFQGYYSPYPVEDTMRGTQTNILKESLQDYSNGNYNQAIPKIKKLLKEYPEKEIYQLYLGNCFLNMGEEMQALSIFGNFPKDSPFHEDAQWYLALTHLKLNNIPKTQAVLENLIEYQGVYEKEARSLLQKISALKKQ
ncbi:hypothetical protein [Spongiimicrobium salis]|uniref:hypothetical protein n=1 Tax=Spongiimicrobium salis TaxID=1667022 RepID=UPI00374CB3B8